MAGEDTVFSSYNARHQLTLRVGIGHTLSVDDRLSSNRQISPHLVQRLFYSSYLIGRHGRSGIAFYATSTVAHVKVATEILGYYVGREQYVAHLYYRYIGHHSIGLRPWAAR